MPAAGIDDPELEGILFGGPQASAGGGPPAAPAGLASPDPELEHLLNGPTVAPAEARPAISARDQAFIYSVPAATWGGIEDVFGLARKPVDWFAERLSGGKFQGAGAAGKALEAATLAIRDSPIGYGATAAMPWAAPVLLPQEAFDKLKESHPALAKILGLARGAGEGGIEVASQVATDPTTYMAGVGAARRVLATKEAAAVFAPVAASMGYSSTVAAFQALQAGEDPQEVAKKFGAAGLADAMAILTAFHLVGGEAAPRRGAGDLPVNENTAGAHALGGQALQEAIPELRAAPEAPPAPAPGEKPILKPGESLSVSEDLQRALEASNRAVEGGNLDPSVQGAMDALPAVPEGSVRLWRWEGEGARTAGGAGGEAGGAWFEKSPGAYYTPGTPPEAGRYIDLTHEEFARLRADPNATEVQLPAEVAARAEPLMPAAGQTTPPTGTVPPAAADTLPFPFGRDASGGLETRGALALDSAGGAPPPEAGGPPGAPSPYEPLTSPQLREPIHREVTTIAGDVMTAAGIPHDPRRLISDELVDHINTGRIPLGPLQAALKEKGISLVDFTQSFFRPAVRDAAQRLQALSALTQRLHKFAKNNPELQDQVDHLSEVGTVLDEYSQTASWWKRLDNLRRGMLVTQISTSMRNMETQAARAAMLMPEQMMDAAVIGALRGIGVQVGNAPHPLDGFRTFGDMLMSVGSRGRRARGNEFIEAVLDAHPDKFRNRLFNTFASDISTRSRSEGIVLEGVDKLFDKAQAGVELLNSLNRGQEFFFRRTIFKSELLQDLQHRGIHDYEGVIREARDAAAAGDEGALAAAQEKIQQLLPEDTMSRAVGKALEMTFAENPAYGTGAYHLLKAINKIPGATLVLPFPRFMWNCLKFYADYSPLGFLKLAAGGAKEAIGRGGEAAIAATTGKDVKLWGSSREIQKLLQGDAGTLSKAMIGSGMLLVAYQMRNSADAGTSWYQWKVPANSPVLAGKQIDLRPFNPFAGYLFIADIIKRYRENDLGTMTKDDWAQGILSTNVRAGTGLALIDAAFKDASSAGTNQDLEKAFAGFAGEYTAGWLTPLQVLTDVVAEFDQYTKFDLQTRKERRTEPFWGPVAPRFGFAGGGQSLPPFASPTREGASKNQYPLLKQLTGLLVADNQNPLEQELQRLHFTPQEIYTGTRSPEADRLVKQAMGQLAEEVMVPFVQSADYLKADDLEKGMLLANMLKPVRQRARATARAEHPEVFEELRRKGLRQRLYEQSIAEQHSEALDLGPPGPPAGLEEE